jgi:hypothetical protein
VGSKSEKRSSFCAYKMPCVPFTGDRDLFNERMAVGKIAWSGGDNSMVGSMLLSAATVKAALADDFPIYSCIRSWAMVYDICSVG